MYLFPYSAYHEGSLRQVNCSNVKYQRDLDDPQLVVIPTSRDAIALNGLVKGNHASWKSRQVRRRETKFR